MGQFTELEAFCEELSSTLPQAPPPHPTDGQDSDDDEDDAGGETWEVQEQEHGSSLTMEQAGHSKHPPRPRGTRASGRTRKAPAILADVSNRQVSPTGCLHELPQPQISDRLAVTCHVNSGFRIRGQHGVY